MGHVGLNREVGEGRLQYVCFFPSTAAQGGYVTQFDQNLRVQVPCFPADSRTEVNQRASMWGRGGRVGEPALLMLFKKRWGSFVLCLSGPCGLKQGCILK